MGALTGLLAAVTEAWGEIRVHRVRVVLSLVGVFLAVFAMTTITAAGNMGRQILVESSERSSGRAATLQVQVSPNSGSVDPRDTTAADALRVAVERHRVRWWGMTSNGQGGQLTVRFAGGTELVPYTAVDPSYATMHRVDPVEGRFFTAADADAYAPRLVVNQVFADRLGGVSPDGTTTVQLGGPRPVTAVVVGLASDPPFSDAEMPSAYVLNAAVTAWDLGGATSAGSVPTLELWVPDADEEALTQALQTELQAALPGYSVSVGRTDLGDSLGVVDVVLAVGVRGIGVFALLLGGIGVLNVGIVTVRQRIREIGVRRSFGATTGRVFFAVLLESVAATFVAGAVAVLLSVVVVSNAPAVLAGFLPAGTTLTDVPPFPVSAAVEGLLAATLVGALAGVVPATMAVRAKVIDAIRY